MAMRNKEYEPFKRATKKLSDNMWYLQYLPTNIDRYPAVLA